MSTGSVSLVIPTYNRAGSLQLVLQALSQQSFPPDCLEVIVVDDGSTDEVPTINGSELPFTFQCVRQANAGATTARNTGAVRSTGEILVFLDDDIDLAPSALQVLVSFLQAHPRVITLGNIQPYVTRESGIYTRVIASLAHEEREAPFLVPPSECLTGILAIRRADFFALGLFRDPTGGWPNWDDVEFGYRAFQAGYQIFRCPKSVGLHRDYSLSSLKTSCQRTARAAFSAAALFRSCPELYNFLPMFHDKSPIVLQSDSLAIICQKLFHTFTALPPFMQLFEGLAAWLERAAPHPILLKPLYRWINSIYIYRGYRAGLRSLPFPGRQG